MKYVLMPLKNRIDRLANPNGIKVPVDIKLVSQPAPKPQPKQTESTWTDSMGDVWIRQPPGNGQYGYLALEMPLMANGPLTG